MKSNNACSTVGVTVKEVVFRNRVLFEAIILALSPPDIFTLAVVVDKKWHSIITTSVAVNKHLLSSPFLLGRLEGNQATDANTTRLDFFWGAIIIKRPDRIEVIYTIDKGRQENFHPPFPHQR